ncbi:MAG: hypothetical protein ACRD3W_03145 [Terriglobales bacterium]
MNTAPTVRDFRHKEPRTIYTVNVPDVQDEPTRIVPIGAPAMGSSRPGTITIDPMSPPPTGFVSNINPGRILPLSLPPGTSSNSGLGSVIGHMNPATAVPPRAPRQGQLIHPSSAAPTASTYGNAPLAGSGASASTARTGVHAEIVAPKRGALLH